MKFIIVDDNDIFREGIKYFLENILNHEVICLNIDGEEFLQNENIYLADIILMDIEMPKLNGIEIAKKALWKYNQLKIIAVTSYTDIAYVEDLICAGFKSIIFKNKFYEEFENTIENVINNKMQFPEELPMKNKISNNNLKAYGSRNKN